MKYSLYAEKSVRKDTKNGDVETITNVINRVQKSSDSLKELFDIYTQLVKDGYGSVLILTLEPSNEVCLYSNNGTLFLGALSPERKKKVEQFADEFGLTIGADEVRVEVISSIRGKETINPSYQQALNL